MTLCHLITNNSKKREKPRYIVIRTSSDKLSCLLFGRVEKKLYLKGEEGG